MRSAVRRLGILAAPILLVAGGCTTPPAPPEVGVPAPFADCAALTSSPSAGPGASAPTGAAPAGDTAPAVLPDLALPCFTGGRPVRLRDIRGPAVLNVWQTACAPCREELPAFQRLADRTAGRLHVAGIISRDSRQAAASFGADLGISFANVDDREMRFLSALGRNQLPATVFVDATGGARLYGGPALDDARLANLVRVNLGVVVP